VDNPTIQCPKCFGVVPDAKATKCMHCRSSIKPSQPTEGITQKSGALTGKVSFKFFGRTLPHLKAFWSAAGEGWTAECNKRNTDDK